MAAQSSLFEVYLRLRPALQSPTPTDRSEPWLLVERAFPTTEPQAKDIPVPGPTHIILQPPNDSRKRAVEKFGFTKVFEEDSTQLDIIESTGTMQLLRNVVNKGSDGLIATLGVTGSGKSHTILGSRSQRGLTQMVLDILFRSIGCQILVPSQACGDDVLSSLQLQDSSEAQILSASSLFDTIYGESNTRSSQARTHLVAGSSSKPNILPVDSSNVAPQYHLLQRRSAPPTQPDVSAFAVEVDMSSDYVVLLSMYEVYNDRIFDLLSPATQPAGGMTTTRHGAALQKDLRRRPLLFKSTELSPDRKMVAGLRKIVCGTYSEAMMVLEAGLAERRVTGTSSNTASSRSHGFFCIEVRNRNRLHEPGTGVWSGGMLSIVDLAGSERARNAKTAGSTLAEAGKINESLMYLGQCLQVQSEQHDGSKPVVPFRQCKLTELLFSNSFSVGSSNLSRAPQKALMIVTADPRGDFNATSQILRYSALAKEVTVPRTPSVTSTILSGLHHASKRTGREHFRHVPHINSNELDEAANEIARRGLDCDQLSVRLAEEEVKRSEAEFKLQAALQAAEEKFKLFEQEIREECWVHMEAELEAEKQRWRKAREEDRSRAEGLLDSKLEILEKGVPFDAHETSHCQTWEEVERENFVLRRKVAELGRQLNLRSPTKKKAPAPSAALTPLKENANLASNPLLSALRKSGDGSSRNDGFVDQDLNLSTDSMALAESDRLFSETLRKPSVPKTPCTAKKIRKLTTRKWDFGDPEGDDDC